VLQNIGAIAVYFQLGITATVALGLMLNPGISWADEIYTGAVAAITAAGNCDVRLMEYV
jgi:hypothetical protein